MSNGIGIDSSKTETRLAIVISRISNSSERLAIMEGRLLSLNNTLMGAPDAPMQGESAEKVNKAGSIGKTEDSLSTLEQRITDIQDQVNRLCDSGII